MHDVDADAAHCACVQLTLEVRRLQAELKDIEALASRVKFLRDTRVLDVIANALRQFHSFIDYLELNGFVFAAFCFKYALKGVHRASFDPSPSF